jgi:hypothetical protein
MDDLRIDKLGKAEIERMYRMAYCVDSGIYRPDDVVDFGIDLRRLKEFGEVEMKKDLSQLRRRATVLWNRMDAHQKAAFLIGDVVAALRTAGGALRALEAVLGRLDEAHDGIDMAYNGLFSKVSGPLKERVEQGLGKWRTNGDPR